ncbi:MAG: DUF938 domain-containing protein [Rhizobiaceae bacterium]
MDAKLHDTRKDSPSFHRNIGPITEQLKEILPEPSLQVLEIGSGSGQHAVTFSGEFPGFTFQPTDVVAENLNSIDSWVTHTGSTNVGKAIFLDVTDPNTHQDIKGQYDIFLCFNVIHITPWEVTEALFQFAENTGTPSARLILYGPFRIDGKQTSESNADFELWLKSKDARFGVRDIDDVQKVAGSNGFLLTNRYTMPANNFMLEFRL